jgi:transcriptional regulator with GAF, ATPase, and Fis domain/tetratricopeptide (TPR) repeat protein
MAALAASALRRAHAYGEASELLEKALPLMEGEARRDALSELADLRKMRGEYGRALHALGRLMMLLPREARGSTLRRAGQLLTLKGSYAAALRLLRKSFTLSSLANDASERAEVRAALAEVHYLRGEHAEAETLCREGLADLADDTTFQTRGDDAREAARVALTNIIGKVRLHQERYDEALEAFEANLRFCRDASRGMEEAAAHNNLGIVFLRRGEYERAESAYQAALDRFEALHDPAGRAFGYQNLGVLHHERADYARALEAYHRGLAGFKRVGNKTQLTNTAINLGNLYLSVGDLSRAERLISFALDIASELSMPLLSAYGYNLLGETLCAAGRWDAARVYLDRAQNLFDEVGNRRLMAEVRLNMARLWLATGKPEKADAALRRVEANVFDERVPKIAGQACLLRAELSFGTGELDKAGEGYEWAREFFVSDSDEEGTWRAHFGLARVAAAQGRTLEAENHYLKARSLIESLCARVPEDLRDTFLREPSRAAVQAELAKLSRDTTLPKRTSARAESSVRRADTLFRAAASDLTQVRSEFSGRRAGGAYEGIIGQSRKLMNVLRVVEKVAPSSSTVLIRGESGTGKERVAEALHRASTRSQKPFVTLNCSALVETLLLSELFGHEKGAFTGAVARKRGRFEVADGGTLFLDEIGDISPKTQVALLRVLQERQFERVGGTTPIKVDVRILCATHRNLEAMVRAGQFREDLYFRLKGVVIEIPPLRDRREDVPLLATHFIERACADDGRAPMLFDEEAMELLMAYDWPGNVRELENLVRTAVLFAEGRVITRADLGSLREFRPTDGDASTAAKGGGTEDVSGPSAEEAVIERVLREEVGLAEMKKHIELECIRRALTRTGGNITQAAKLLRMKRPRLSQIVKEYSDVLKIDTAD